MRCQAVFDVQLGAEAAELVFPALRPFAQPEETVGLLVHCAGIQDRDGAVPTLRSIRHFYPFLRFVFTDGGYAGDKLKQALKSKGYWTIQVIRRRDNQKGFKVLPRRGVIERTFA